MSRRIITIVIVLIILISFPLLLLTLRQSQDTRQRADVEDTSLLAAKFSDQVVTKAELETYIKEVAGENAPSFLANPTTRKYFLDLYLEKKLIESEAKKRNIVISTSAIADKKQALTEDELISEGERTALLADEKALTLVLEKELVADDVETWKTVDLVSVYISPETTDYAQDKTKAQAVLEEMRGLVSSSTTLPQAFATMQRKYPGETSQMRVQENYKITKANKMDSQLKTPLFLVKKDTVSPVIPSTGGAIMLAFVLDENISSFASFDEWFTAQKKGVTYY